MLAYIQNWKIFIQGRCHCRTFFLTLAQRKWLLTKVFRWDLSSKGFLQFQMYHSIQISISTKYLPFWWDMQTSQIFAIDVQRINIYRKIKARLTTSHHITSHVISLHHLVHCTVPILTTNFTCRYQFPKSLLLLQNSYEKYLSLYKFLNIFVVALLCTVYMCGEFLRFPPWRIFKLHSKSWRLHATNLYIITFSVILPTISSYLWIVWKRHDGIYGI